LNICYIVFYRFNRNRALQEGFVGVCLEWGILKHRCVIINVYSKCDLEAKSRFWERIMVLRREIGDEAWCVLGDFNVVCHREEIKRG
jgi:hypothetical protein